jgi:cytoskeletal protein RodZ
METVGVYLKKEREAKAISLGEVARLTKISKFYLDFIEKDEFEKLPQGPYIKGYISSYSEQIGSDVDEALKLYDALNKKENLTETVNPDDWKTEESPLPVDNEQMGEHAKTPIPNPTDSTFSIRRTSFYGSIALLVVVIAILAGFGFYHLFLFEEKTPVLAGTTPTPIQAPDDTPPSVIATSHQTESAAMALSNQPQEKIGHQRESRFDKTDALITHSPQGPLLEKVTDTPGSLEKVRSKAPEEHTHLADIAVNTIPAEQLPSADLTVLKAHICSNIKDRIPAGIATTFPSSTQRVYVWNQIKAEKIPTEIRHIYYFNDKKISEVTLKVRSNLWRTWSYKTLPGGKHQGRWRVDIAAADGTVLERLHFEINSNRL